MYVVGADHPLKHAARALVDRAASARERLVTDAEVFQELLHRYRALNRYEAIDPAFAWLTAVANEIYPITRDDVFRARDLVTSAVRLGARDAVHVAVMEHHDVGGS
jgi:predicted nucleic acid-binding protein